MEKSVLRALGGSNPLEHYQNLTISRENFKRIFNIASSIPDVVAPGNGRGRR